MASVSNQSSASHSRKKPRSHPQPVQEPPPGNAQPIGTKGPQFAEPTPDPTQFSVRYGSDDAAYRTPVVQGVLSNGKDKVVLENYDGQDYVTYGLSSIRLNCELSTILLRMRERRRHQMISRQSI
jgi:hypothetical protein